MENYNNNSKENISVLCNLVNQSINVRNTNKFNKYIWWKEINQQLIHLFNMINKSFIKGSSSSENSENLNQKQVTENCLVYGDQILNCLIQFQDIFLYEQKHFVTLKSSSQFLADRLYFSLEKMNSSTALSTKNNRNIDKLLNNLETIFDFIKLLNTKTRTEILDFLHEFNSLVEDAISQAIEFACFLEDANKIAIKSICNKILNNHKAFVNEFSTCYSDESDNGLVGGVKFKADLLYNSVIKLEVTLNDCFLRLIFTTFSYLGKAPLKTIVKNKEAKEIDRFDLANERLLQIGVYAAYYTDDLKIKSKILSGLVTIESLDAYLIPTIMSDSDEFRRLLVKTWECTAKSLQYHIHSVIDTIPFLNGIECILVQFLDIPKQTLDASQVDNIILQLKIISNHFHINAYDYEEVDITQHVDNFKLMIRELIAINNCFDKVDTMKIIKRIKIVKSILKKIITAIEKKEYADDDDDISTSNLSKSNITNKTKSFHPNMAKPFESTFVKKTEESGFDIEISNILNEFLMLTDEF